MNNNNELFKRDIIYETKCTDEDEDEDEDGYCQKTEKIEKENYINLYDIDYYLEYQKSVVDNFTSWYESWDRKPKITKAKAKSVLDKNIYYINSQSNYNVISKEWSSYLEIGKALETKINEKQEAINNLNTQITELTLEINKPNDDLNSVNSKLIIAGKDNPLRFFTPSFYSKYTTTTRWLLAPYSAVSFSTGIAQGFLVAEKENIVYWEL